MVQTRTSTEKQLSWGAGDKGGWSGVAFTYNLFTCNIDYILFNEWKLDRLYKVSQTWLGTVSFPPAILNKNNYFLTFSPLLQMSSYFFPGFYLLMWQILSITSCLLLFCQQFKPEI